MVLLPYRLMVAVLQAAGLVSCRVPELASNGVYRVDVNEVVSRGRGAQVGDVVDDGPGGAKERLIELLRGAMTARKWRQTDLAKHAEISIGTVSNVLRGIRVPSVVTLDLILSALEFSTDETVEMRRLRDLADPRGGG
jgi:hypothetical protein